MSNRTHQLCVNVAVRFVREVFKRSSISERDARYLERVVNRHLTFQFVVNNGNQAGLDNCGLDPDADLVYGVARNFSDVASPSCVLLRIPVNENNREALRERLPDKWANSTN